MLTPPELREILFRVGDAGKEGTCLFIRIGSRFFRQEDVTDPHILFHSIELPGHGKNLSVPHPGQLFVLFFINCLDVEKDCIRDLHQAEKISVPGVFFGIDSSARVEAGGDAFGLCPFEELCHEGQLQEGLPAGDRDAALLSPVGPIAEGFLQDLFCRIFCTFFCLPGVRIVAEGTPQGAALQEDDEADTGSVDGAEGFEGVHVSFH